MYPKTIVLYHAGCMDGLAAAFAAFVKFGNDAVYRPVTYSTVHDISHYVDCDLYVLDYSFKREVYLELCKVAKSIVILDHHKTAQEELGDLVGIDLTKSGAVLSWEYFHPTVSLPELFKFVQDYDLWQWKYEETKAVNAYLHSKPLTLESFGKTMLLPLENILFEGNILVNYLAKEMQQAIKRLRLVRFLGYEIPIVNAPANICSELGNELSKHYPFSLTYYDNRDLRLFSLRANKDKEYDVSLMAKRFGGGGHKLAAGFSLPLDSQLLDNFAHGIGNPPLTMFPVIVNRALLNVITLQSPTKLRYFNLFRNGRSQLVCEVHCTNSPNIDIIELFTYSNSIQELKIGEVFEYDINDETVTFTCNGDTSPIDRELFFKEFDQLDAMRQHQYIADNFRDQHTFEQVVHQTIKDNPLTLLPTALTHSTMLPSTWEALYVNGLFLSVNSHDDVLFSMEDITVGYNRAPTGAIQHYDTEDTLIPMLNKAKESLLYLDKLRTGSITV